MTAPEPKEIRQRYTDYQSEWRETQEEAQTDMRFVSGDPWEPEDRKAREEAGRPCMAMDEINQYLNQWINNIRQNKRAIQVNPKGGGATDKDAERRANIIRGIEYRSNAQAAYITAAENMINRSYGFARLTTAYDGDKSFNQEIRIKRIPNPDTVLLNPDYKEADASDMEDGFLTDLLRKEDFKRLYGTKAKVVSFSGEHMQQAEGWIRDKYVQVAEFWKVHKVPRKLLLVNGGEQGPIAFYEDEIKDMKGLTILKDRKVEQKKVCQYITNGLEILDTIDWAGSYIPILACFGKELFIDDGSGSKRVLLSMVRLARDPQMLHAYLTSQEAEEAGMTPKAPFVGYTGQFVTDLDAWETLAKVPRSFVQADPMVDTATGQVLPLPTRPAFQPNFQAYEMAKESARRSIQAAMGISPLPTSAQRQNEKSGVALDRIQTAEAVGSFHFTDNYDRFLENAGRQINELIGPIYDTARDVPTRNAKEEHAVLRINDPKYAQANPDKDHLDTQKGEFDSTIKAGPSYQSQREMVSEFVDLLVQNLKNLPVPPQVAAQIMALAIKLKNLGPIGEEIADLLSPPNPQDMPPQVQAAMAQSQAAIQELQQKLQELLMEKQANTVDNQFKLQIARENNEVKLEVAEITTKYQEISERMALMYDLLQKLHVTAHEAATQAVDQSHQHTLADKAAANTAAQSDQGHQQTLEQQQQAAELQPEPVTE